MIKYNNIHPCVNVEWKTYKHLGILACMINFAGMTLYGFSQICPWSYSILLVKTNNTLFKLSVNYNDVH